MQVEGRPAHLTSMVFDSWTGKEVEEFPFKRTEHLKHLTWEGPNLDRHKNTIASFSQLTELQIMLCSKLCPKDIRGWPYFPALRKLCLQQFLKILNFVHLVSSCLTRSHPVARDPEGEPTHPSGFTEHT